MDARTVRDLGEFGLIDRLRGMISASAAVVGIGDDAAVLELGGSDYVLATVDMMVAGVHFELDFAEPFEVGRRAVAGNVSDIAAMGGEPTFALVSLALPPSCPIPFVDALYEGIAHEASLTGVGIVGGNMTSTSGPTCVDMTVLGRVPKDQVVLRSGARPGDLLAVTGSLGSAAARRLGRARHLFMAPSGDTVTTEPSVTSPSRVSVARRLASQHIPHAMLDLSDGLAGDIRHLCTASGVGAVLHARDLPISDETRELAVRLDMAPTSLALTGGEDYELLLAFDPRDLGKALEAAGDTPLTVIGQIVDQSSGVTVLSDTGESQTLSDRGWTHF